jgi:hypothetical protein
LALIDGKEADPQRPVYASNGHASSLAMPVSVPASQRLAQAALPSRDAFEVALHAMLKEAL